MKRSLCLSLVFAAMFSAYTAHAEETCTKIIMTGHPDYPAMAFREGDRIDGAAAALVEAIAKDLKVPLESKYMGTWSEAIAATREGKADMIVGVYLNKERTQYLDYVEPAFAYDPVVVFVAAGKPFDFKDQADLIGKKGVANKGESFGSTFDTFIKDQLTVTRTDGIAAALGELIDDEADYVIAGYYPGTAEVDRLGFEDEIVALEPALLSAEMFVAFSKKSPCRTLAPKFSEGITEITTEGRFHEMVRNAMAEWGISKSPSD